jgi:adenine-specific DNA-methyltransferase
MKKLNGSDEEARSADVVGDNLAKLKKLFPELLTETAEGAVVNVDILKQLVGDKTITDADEKYGLNWHGKRRARQVALTPSAGTLRPCPEDSVDWEKTKNLMIEGDNLEVLKLLQKSYAGKVKLIYIDPPYNTGKDFVYPDNFQDSIRNYLELTGQSGEGGARLTTNVEASGRFHTDWLSMMYPRLKLARNLLREDGVIFISIDDSEVSNLRKLCDDIFGEENFISTIIWEKRYSPQNAVQWFSEAHDFILVYAANKNMWQPNLLERSDEMNARYRNLDNDPRGDWKPADATAQAGHGTASQFYELTTPSGRTFQPPNGRCWVYTKDRMEEMIADNRVWFGSDGSGGPAIKRFLTEVKQGVACQTIWKYEDVGHNQEGKKEIKVLFPESVPFDTPKPTRLIARMLQIATAPAADDLVVDFFGGSGSTAHAVYDENVADGGKRRFILVQLPEPTDQKDYPSIADITKERLRRAGKKIRDENPLFSGDLGFRVFKLDSTNIREWDPDKGKIAESLEAHVEHIKADRSEQDILFELLLKLGLDLCVPIETKKIQGKEVHSIGAGALIACLAPEIKSNQVELLAQGIVVWHKAQNTAGDSMIVFRDSAFADDIAKTNLTSILNQNGLHNVRSL